MTRIAKIEYSDMSKWEILAEKDGMAFLYAPNGATRYAAEVDEGERNFAFTDSRITFHTSKDAAVAALPNWILP